MSLATFGLNSFKQLGLCSLQIMSEIRSCLESFGIHLETFSQLLCRRIVKEGNVLVEIRYDQLLAEFFIIGHAAEAPANHGLDSTQGHERFHVEQFNAAGLKQRGVVARM